MGEATHIVHWDPDGLDKGLPRRLLRRWGRGRECVCVGGEELWWLLCFCYVECVCVCTDITPPLTSPSLLAAL